MTDESDVDRARRELEDEQWQARTITRAAFRLGVWLSCALLLEWMLVVAGAGAPDRPARVLFFAFLLGSGLQVWAASGLLGLALAVAEVRLPDAVEAWEAVRDKPDVEARAYLTAAYAKAAQHQRAANEDLRRRRRRGGWTFLAGIVAAAPFLALCAR